MEVGRVECERQHAAFQLDIRRLRIELHGLPRFGHSVKTEARVSAHLTALSI